ncbi:ISL3 family transposase [Dactylosporangium vinaceum]|uniref:ISL3 family transposase n=1 Tax=Dactylosporangium vinaceum TaxID=53362 RepID=A0ABV5MLG9_9ACTN|nr:ISL3 family transposase [Dactylosporangium vinaceum]UAC01398.1 ISL3 family transposase [Dactylosporangium vinaceum]
MRSATGVCGRCGVASRRIHGGYLRELRDVAAGGLDVKVRLRVRRFRCDNADCSAMTFAEQVPGLTRPHDRFTPLLCGLLTQIGLALAGRAGVRLAAAAGLGVSRDTLLRLVRALPDPVMGPVRAVGVDDFAFRRGRRYDTVLIDMDTRRPLDLFEGRDGDDLAVWLRRHPETEVVCRDRAGGYAEGASQGAPQAVQVADRFHLWQNLGQAVEKTVNEHRAHLGEPTLQVAVADAPPAIQQLPELKIVARFREQHAAVHALVATGLSKAAIGRELGLHPATVRKIVRARSVDDLTAITEQRTHLVDDYTGYLHRRWHEGERNATALFREIRQLGYPGGELAVQRYLRRFRHGRGHAAQIGPKPPSVRKVTSWFMTRPDRLNDAERAALQGIRVHDAALRRLVGHVRAFAVMMTGRHGNRLEEWINAVERDTLAPLASFARGLRRDYDAVHNGLSLPCSSGAVEGTVNRIKMLKRQMFGRAGLDLLRKRILLSR